MLVRFDASDGNRRIDVFSRQKRLVERESGSTATNAARSVRSIGTVPGREIIRLSDRSRVRFNQDQAYGQDGHAVLKDSWR